MKKNLLIIGSILVVSLITIILIYRIVVNAGASKNGSNVKIDDEASLFDKTQRLMTQGNEDGAISNLENVIIKYPDSPRTESSYFALASIYEKRRDFLKAKDLYQKIIEKFPTSKYIIRSQEALDNINIKILFSPIMTHDSFAYEVQKGDTLAKLAKKYNTTIELISKANDIKGSNIKIGRKLKIVKAKFSIVVDKSQNILTLKADEYILKTYRVSTGQNFSTPTGNFKITNKIVEPTWYTAGAVVPAGSPKNILGSRWLGISQPGYGIHGTTSPQSIGSQVTAGCVRMRNSDVEELYAIVTEGTEVVIVD